MNRSDGSYRFRGGSISCSREDIMSGIQAYRIDHKSVRLRLVSDHPSNEPTLSLIER